MRMEHAVVDTVTGETTVAFFDAALGEKEKVDTTASASLTDFVKRIMKENDKILSMMKSAPDTGG